MLQFRYRHCFCYCASIGIKSIPRMHRCRVSDLAILCAGRRFLMLLAIHGNTFYVTIFFILIIKCDGRIILAPQITFVLPVPCEIQNRICVIHIAAGSRCRFSVRLLCRKAERSQIRGQNRQCHACCEKLLDFSSHYLFLPKRGPFRWKRPVYLPPGPIPRSSLTG